MWCLRSIRNIVIFVFSIQTTYAFCLFRRPNLIIKLFKELIVEFDLSASFDLCLLLCLNFFNLALQEVSIVVDRAVFSLLRRLFQLTFEVFLCYDSCNEVSTFESWKLVPSFFALSKWYLWLIHLYFVIVDLKSCNLVNPLLAFGAHFFLDFGNCFLICFNSNRFFNRWCYLKKSPIRFFDSL